MDRRQFLSGASATAVLGRRAWAQAPAYKPGAVELLLSGGFPLTDARLANILAKHSASIGVSAPVIGLYEVRVPVGEEALTLAALRALGAGVEASYIPLGTTPPVFSINPNDTNVGSQWYLSKMNISGTGGAWDLLGNYGSSSIVIAELNTGNSAASPEVPPNLVAGYNIPAINTTTTDMDTSFLPAGHGTATESTVFSPANNSSGVAGIANGCTLMPVVVYYISISTTTDVTTCASGVTWAANNGAKIISVCAANTGASTTGMKTAVNYARSKGCIVVSGSNDGNPSGTASAGFVVSPGDCPGVLCAVPVDSSDTTPSYFGGVPYGHIAVPGVGIEYYGKNSAAGSADGISFSIPLLAGACGLVWSANAHLSAQDVATILLSTTDRIGGQTRRSDYFGLGRINVGRAVKAAQTGFLNNQAMMMGVN